MATHFKNILLLALVLFPHFAVAKQKHYILVLSKADKKMMVLDYSTLETITSIPVEDDPHEIVVSADQTTAYVSNAQMNDRGHNIHVVDLKTLKLKQTIDTTPFYVPHGLVYLHDELWFTAQGSKVVVKYDLRAGKPEEVFGTGQDFTHLIYVTPDGNRFYTTNVESGTVSIFEKKELPPYMPPTGVLPPNAKSRLEWRQTLVNVGYGAEGFDVSSDGKELWTARPDGHVIIVDLDKKEIKADLDSKIPGLHRLKFTPDGKSVAVVSVKTGDLIFFDAEKRKMEEQTHLCQGAGLFMDGESSRMFISCTSNNAVSVIDLKTRKEVKRVQIGRPDAITSANLP